MQQFTPQRKENIPDLHVADENDISMAYIYANGAEKFLESYFIKVYQPGVQQAMLSELQCPCADLPRIFR